MELFVITAISALEAKYNTYSYGAPLVGAYLLQGLLRQDVMVYSSQGRTRSRQKRVKAI